MDTIPFLMRIVVGEFRNAHPFDLSIPQFRVLVFLRENAGTGLSALADYIRLALPTVSKVVDGLVKRGFVLRSPSERDRRCIVLRCSESGICAMDAARGRAESRMAALLSGCSDEEKQAILAAMTALRSAFEPSRASG